MGGDLSDRNAVPSIDGNETFDALVRKLSVYFQQHIETPHTFEELGKAQYVKTLRPLVKYLTEVNRHPSTISALLALKWHFSEAGEDDRGVTDTRALACELVAWRVVTHLTDGDAIDALCYDQPAVADIIKAEVVLSNGSVHEQTPLLDGAHAEAAEDRDDVHSPPDIIEDDVAFSATFAGLNGLEIAAVAGAKKFLSQKAVQRHIDGIWRGDIVFWSSLSTHSTKRAEVYSKERSDPFCRLRVPLYLKCFEVLFFAAFIALYYVVLIQKSSIHHLTVPEVLLYVWLLAFAHNELGEYWDAGSLLYSRDFWSLWDLMIIATGLAFFLIRMTALWQGDRALTDVAYDVLSIEALFLVPRTFSLLSLVPYFGTLLVSLKEMTRDFVKFLSLVAILYAGWTTTFVFIARGTYSVGKINWILVKVFFGSSYLGFDVADQISPILGPPLMIVFVCMTNILLMSSLISLLSNSLAKILEHAREEYLTVYSTYVLEASTSNRLVYFLPPLNLVALAMRPLRLFVSAASLRDARIVTFKALHWPFVAIIMAYEAVRRQWGHGQTRDPFASASARTTIPELRRRLTRRLTPAVPASTRQSPLDDETHTPRSLVADSGTTPPAALQTIEAWEKAVGNIQQQLELLSSLISNEKENLNTRESDSS